MPSMITKSKLVEPRLTIVWLRLRLFGLVTLHSMAIEDMQIALYWNICLSTHCNSIQSNSFCKSQICIWLFNTTHTLLHINHALRSREAVMTTFTSC